MKQVEYDRTLNDSKWHIVYGTIVNDIHLVNEIEWHLCDILNDTSCRNVMNFEWYNVEWVYEYWNNTMLNEQLSFGMIQYWMT